MADDITRMAARLMDVLTPTVRAHRWNGLSWNRDGTISIRCRCSEDFDTWEAFADHMPSAAE